MAEAVQQLLERQVEELNELHRRGIFTQGEIREIVKKRRGFEYALRRRQKRKEDYLAYVQYELNVEALRRKRKAQLNIQHRTKHSEYAIIQRVHFIFQRALQKFKGDLRLWLQYFDFCDKTRGAKILGKAYATALQFHSFNAGLWIKAAKWEWETNANVQAARVLFQRGLRLNPQARELWLEYFRLELLYLDKMIKRQKILGIYNPDALPRPAALQASREPSTAEVGSEDSDSDSDDAQGEGGYEEFQQLVNVPVLPEEADHPAIELPADKDMFLAGLIPQLIVKQAREAIPDDVPLLMSFIRIYRLFDNTKAHRDTIYASLPLGAEALDARCRRALEDQHADEELTPEQALEAALDCHQQFVKVCLGSKDEALWALHVRFLCEMQSSADMAGHADWSALLRTTCMQAQERHCASEPVYLAWAQELHAIGLVREALEACVYGTAAVPSSCSLWLLRASLAIRLTDEESILQVFAQARRCISEPEERAQLWHMERDYYLLRGDMAAIETAFKNACQDRVLAAASQVQAEYLEWAALSGGLRLAKKVYEYIFSLDQPSQAFLRKCIFLELAQPAVDVKRTRMLFERAVSLHGTLHADLWVDYVAFEEVQHNSQQASLLYWRAVKTLKDSEAFLVACNLHRMQKST